MSKIKELLGARENNLKALLGISKVITHPTGSGDNSEETWRKFLREVLPNKFAITKGYAIDSRGSISEQIDIIIYDSLYSPLILIAESGEKYVPVESIYSIIEVKPEINSSTLKYADDKIESVKRLYRSSRGIIVGGVKKPKRELTKILGIILAKGTSMKKKATIEKNINECKNINIGCALDKITFNCIRNNDNSLKNIEFSSENEVVLSLFFHLQNELHELGTVAAIDIREYANALESFDFNTKEDFRVYE